jgi:hypothetical protein
LLIPYAGRDPVPSVLSLAMAATRTPARVTA